MITPLTLLLRLQGYFLPEDGPTNSNKIKMCLTIEDDGESKYFFKEWLQNRRIEVIKGVLTRDGQTPTLLVDLKLKARSDKDLQLLVSSAETTVQKIFSNEKSSSVQSLWGVGSTDHKLLPYFLPFLTDLVIAVQCVAEDSLQVLLDVMRLQGKRQKGIVQNFGREDIETTYFGGETPDDLQIDVSHCLMKIILRSFSDVLSPKVGGNDPRPPGETTSEFFF